MRNPEIMKSPEKKKKTIFQKFGFGKSKTELNVVTVEVAADSSRAIKSKHSNVSIHSFSDSDLVIDLSDDPEDKNSSSKNSNASILLSLDVPSCFMPNTNVSEFPGNSLYQEALKANRASLKTLIATNGEDHPDVNVRKVQTAEVYQGLGMMQEAADLLSEVVESYHRSDNDPVLLSSAMNDLALVYSTLHQYEHAEVLFDKTVQILSQTVEADQAVLFGNIGITLRNSGKYSKAIPMHELAVKMMSTILGKDSADTLFQQGQLAVTLKRTGNPVDARRGAELLTASTLRLGAMGYGQSHVWITALLQ